MKVSVDQAKEFEDPSNGKLRYLRPFIVLLPTFIVCVYDIYAKIPFTDSMLRLLITILFFYFVGSIAQGVIRRLMIKAELDKNDEFDISELSDYDDEDDEEEEEEE
ncbi:MAG: hypothetical protein K5656_11225 [Lachnospiraceae bacterium]|nr:hypothetical protein [Lachnospiraceae bacterium]